MYAFRSVYLTSAYSVVGNMIDTVFIVRRYITTIASAFTWLVVDWKLLSTTFCKTWGRDCHKNILSFTGVYRSSGNHFCGENNRVNKLLDTPST